MPRTFPAALPACHILLRILLILNGIYGVGVFLLLVAMIVAGDATLAALGGGSHAWLRPMLFGFEAIAVFGLAAVPINHAVLKRLLAIVETVRRGDPFVGGNAVRLQAIAWGLLALQILSMIIGAIGDTLSTEAHPIHLDAGFSASGWLAVLLTFILARIFTVGAMMREDLEATV